MDSITVVVVLTILAISARTGSGCGFPGSPPHAKVVTTDERFMEGSVVTFECDPGYQFLGRSMLRCVNSEWDSQGKPYCVREVVEVKFGQDMTNLSIKLSVVNPGSVDNATSDCFESSNISALVGASQYFTCDRSTFGRELVVTLVADRDFSLKLCEVKVYSQGVLSPQDACGKGSKGKIETLKGYCYEVTPNEVTSRDAVAFCASQGGSLWTGDQSEFVSWMMNVHNLDSVWYQSDSNSTNCSAFSRDDQLDRTRPQKDLLCSETRFAICVRPPHSCGRPRMPKHLASWNRIAKVPTGISSDDFRCEAGYHLSGPSTYHCLDNGSFRQQMPTTCARSTCGKPPVVPNAYPVLGAKARYHCVNDSFVLYGSPDLKCDALKSQWATPHVVCVRLSTGTTTYTTRSLQERLLQGADLFPTATKIGLGLFITTLIIIKVLMAVAIFNLVRFYSVVKPELVRKHNSTVMLFSMHDELSRNLDRGPVSSGADDNKYKLELNNGPDFELSSGDAHVVTRSTSSSTPKAPETPKMRLNESSIREFKTD